MAQQVEVRFNDFSGLWEVHGEKVSYWMFEGQARKRAVEVQALLDEKRDTRLAQRHVT